MSSPAKQIEAAFAEKFKPLFKPKRYKVYYGGRGAGKSWSFARALLILGAQKPIRVLCARETMKSIGESVHQLLSDQIANLGLGGFYTIQKASIMGANGTEFIFAGIRQNVHNLKSYEACDICWVEEAQTVTKSSWDVLIPTIRKEGSEIWVSFNPELESDETFQRFVVHGRTDATVIKVNWPDNPWFTEVMRTEKDHLLVTDKNAYDHVWEGMCKTAVEGAIYLSELTQAESEGRLTKVPWEPVSPVHTFWDLGFGDATAIWFGQTIGFEFRLIDYLEGCQQGLQFYLKELQRKSYLYGNHYLPHDATAHELGSGRTIEEQIAAVFPGKVQIVPRLSLEDGIAAARAIFPKCWFDRENCADGVQALRHYRYEKDEKMGTTGKDAYKRQPLHDWSSHAADAFRYFAVAIQEPKRKRKQKMKLMYQYPGQQTNSWMGG